MPRQRSYESIDPYLAENRPGGSNPFPDAQASDDAFSALATDIRSQPDDLFSDEEFSLELGRIGSAADAAADQTISGIDVGSVGGAAATFLAGNARERAAVGKTAAATELTAGRKREAADRALQKLQVLLGLEASRAGVNLNFAQLGETARQFDASLTQSDRQFDATFGFQQDQAQRSHYLAMLQQLANFAPGAFEGGQAGYQQTIASILGRLGVSAGGAPGLGNIPYTGPYGANAFAFG